MPSPETMDETARTGSAAGKPGDGQSAGALLRAARERQGMHIATLAAAIKVAPRKLEALEQDRWDELPGPTFTRALAQAVCRALKADPQPVMELLPAADTSMLDSTFGTINEPFAGPGGREPGLRGLVPRGPWLIAAIVLLAAAALVIWLPAGFFGRLLIGGTPSGAGGDGGVSAATPAAATAGPGAAATGGTVAPVPFGAPAPAAAVSPAPGQATTAATAQVPARPTVPGTAPPGGQGPAGAAVAGAAAGDPAAAALPAGELVFQCDARTWIEVVDGRGRVLLSRNLEAGESLGLDGVAPLNVVVGNAAATRVTYRGKPVDVASRARDNVARLELK